MMPTFFQAICSTCIALAIYTASLAIDRLFLSPLAKFPGPALAAVTSWYEVFFDVLLGGQFMWEIDRLHGKYGPVVRINPHELHIKDPDYYNTLYAGPTKRRDKYLWFLSVGVPTSTFATAESDHHRLRRGMISPFLSKQAVRDWKGVIKGKLDLLCEHMKKAMRTGEAVELNASFVSFAVDVVSTCAFGESGCFEVLRRERLDDRWKKAVSSTFAQLILTRHFPWLVVVFRFLPVWVSALVAPEVRYIYFMEKAVEHQIQYVYAKSRDGIKENSIFSQLMHNHKLPPKERTLHRLTDEAKFLMFAGTEAPSQVLAITMFHVVRSPLVCRDLRRELQDKTEHLQHEPCLSVLENLPYLTAVVKEGLRVSAVVTSRLPRIAPDEMLEFRDWKIPPGVWYLSHINLASALLADEALDKRQTPVSMSNHFILRDPAIFPDPLVFQPGRWLKPSPIGLNLDKYLVPFSKGSQGCLGPTMAYAWLYLALATLLRKFEFSLSETTEENIRTVRDCFNGQTKPGQNRIRVKVLMEFT
ncbi:putative cytochrome P450 [Aspergillus bombycis]|uniref:Putative cytochrome P450 n=1 Tax=Aspergillus bombycis TaxID=109264 RepID=A0A1F8AD94_9EURO|nr:putative cytochrome P450 [Aspergillus bombycis]OGM49318.1 putative cytochrome P450 [Aspergillus bombycis]